jgi:hypothetical protein
MCSKCDSLSQWFDGAHIAAYFVWKGNQPALADFSFSPKMLL